MNITFPIIELVDRFAIARVKFSRTQANADELEFYQNQINAVDLAKVSMDISELEYIHNQIWDLEKELKSGQENQLALSEIGRRAIEIRNLNNKRIALKNQIAGRLNCSIREIKKDHISE